jgi:hypothetical protein
MKLILTLILLLIIIKLFFDNKKENFNQEINYETEYQISLVKSDAASSALKDTEDISTSSAAVAKATAAASAAVSALSKVANDKAESEKDPDALTVSSDIIAKTATTAANAASTIAKFATNKANKDKEILADKIKEKEEAEKKLGEAKIAVEKAVSDAKTAEEARVAAAKAAAEKAATEKAAAEKAAAEKAAAEKAAAEKAAAEKAAAEKAAAEKAAAEKAAAEKAAAEKAAAEAKNKGMLYEFKEHTFTTAGKTGREGPTLQEVKQAYSGVNWAQNSEFLNMTKQGIQEWKVPATGTYKIIARGAAGGNPGSFGKGRVMRTENVTLTKGEVLKILVGQQGVKNNRGANNGGGGGGTFVVRDTQTPIIVAGGGGGRGEGGNEHPNSNAAGWSNLEPGNSGGDGSPNNGKGGTDGNGGLGSASHAGGGGGLLGDGGNSLGGSFGGKSFINGGIGGIETNYNSAYGGFGGGGGGGAGGGGGGGYSGGGGGYDPIWASGGGGNSYIIPSMSSDDNATNNGPGSVTITLVNITDQQVEQISYLKDRFSVTTDTGPQNINKMMTGRIYIIGASGTRSRDSNNGSGYGGMVIVDVVDAYIGLCIAGPSNAPRSDNRMMGGKHGSGPRVGPDLGGSASSVAWKDGTEFLIAGAGGSAGKLGQGGDGGENVNYVGGQMGQLGKDGVGAGPSRGADYSTNVGGGNGGDGVLLDGGAGGGGYGGGGGSTNGCCGASDTGGGGGGNRVLNYKNCIKQIVYNGTSRNSRNLLPAELTRTNFGVPPDMGGLIYFIPKDKLMLQVDGKSELIPSDCALGDYKCQAKDVCEKVTGLTCVHQDYDCAFGNKGSWYPQGTPGSSTFNFAYDYDLYGGYYGNICSGDPSYMDKYGLAKNYQAAGLGKWTRQ